MKTYVLALALAAAVSANAQDTGTCEAGSAQAFLDANNVRAAIYNTGNLFWRGGAGNIYTVPKNGANSIFSANLWIGGLLDGELHMTGSDYGQRDFYPGPLTEMGGLPNPSDCSAYDRIYDVTVRDLERFDETGEATADILDWPWELGAPVADGDGDPDNYDVAGGDRPEITGHQMLWWVMNDLGGPPGWRDAPPLGIEVRASVFAVMSIDAALDHTTFYRYRITNKQSHAIDSTYVGFWVDADLGHANDDYVGADTTLGMSYYYNGDNEDEGEFGYGTAPPAIGFDFVQGPLAAADDVDNDRDGVVDEGGERLGMTAFLSDHHDGSPYGNPRDGAGAYSYLRGVWQDGTPMTLGGSGLGGNERTAFMYPGDPVTGSFWSEVNIDGAGARNWPSDRHSVMSTGPFRLEPHETQEVVVAIVWTRGDDYLDSITKLRDADAGVQDVWDTSKLRNLRVPPLPDSSPALQSPADGADRQPITLTLNWSASPYVSEYYVELAASPSFDDSSYRVLSSTSTTVDVDSLLPFTDYFWRVHGESALFDTPLSEIFRFSTADAHFSEVGVQTIPGSSNPAFLEIAGPGGADPCEGRTVSGCPTAGGDLVYASFNSTNEYVMYRVGPGPEESLPSFVPHDFDIRFTEEGSFGSYALTSGRVIHVPFEIWDVGRVGLFSENDPSDDVQLIPVLEADGGGDCVFGYDEGDDPFGLGWGLSDRIHAYYPLTSNDDWEETVIPLIDAEFDFCYDGDDGLLAMIDFERGRPLQNITFIGDPALHSAPGEGTVIRFYTSPDALTSPLLAAPANESGPREQPLSLWWNAQYGPQVSYDLQVSADPTFENPVLDAETKDESFTVSGLDEGHVYHWRVRLSHPEGPWSDAWTFTAGEVTNVSAKPTADLPTKFTLDQNYPNPFNPSTTIRFGLPEPGPVQIVVYDVLGRRVTTLVDGTLTSGWHDVTWDAAENASGVYVYSIRTDRHAGSKSMVLMR